MNETEENRFNEIWTLADLDDAIDRIPDEDAGWGVGVRPAFLDCEVFQDLIAPSLFKICWRGTPASDQYSLLYANNVLPSDAVRIDWNRGPRGVWEVFRSPSRDLH